MYIYRTIKLFFLITLAALYAGTTIASPINTGSSTEKLLSLSMEELMNVKIVTASKRGEYYYDTAAAVFIISNEDIRRAGARSIPEALRLAPGVEVAKVTSNQYAIAIRGQNDLFSDKLLVLMDGRSIYTPTSSGVYWLTQNYPMQDIDRIEVIRGPSGAIWGANAVNGVINIITKNAHQTTNNHITVGGGIEDRGFGSIRIGGDRGKFAFRTYVMSEERDGGIYPNESDNPAVFPAAQDAPDDYSMTQGGFRADWLYSEKTDISLHGDIYKVKSGAFGTYVPTPFTLPTTTYTAKQHYKGHNLTSEMTHTLAGIGNFRAQAYYDQYNLNFITHGERRTTYDLDLQFNSERKYGHLISVGTDYRTSRSDVFSKGTVTMPDDTLNIISFFINDDIELIPEQLRLIAGVKFERNSYMSWQTQPHLRAIYSADNWSIWAAASKAVRSPNKYEQSVTANVISYPAGVAGPSPVVIRGIGNGSVKPEEVRSYEVGIRFHPRNLLLQVNAFSIDYRGISDLNGDKIAVPVDPANPLGNYMIPFYMVNVLDGKSSGIEADITWQMHKKAKIKATYTYLDQSYRPVAALTGNPLLLAEAQATVQSTLKQSPQHRYSLGLSLDPTESLEVDLNLYGWSLYRNDGFGPRNPATNARRSVNSYSRLDARLSWQATDKMRFTLAGQNLLKAAHREDIDSALEYSSLIQQSFYIKMDYSY